MIKYRQKKSVNPKIISWVEKNIIPRYRKFDGAHQEDHARMVISQSLEIAKHYDVNLDMVYVIAAYHDLGLGVSRKTHHLESGKILRGDKTLPTWFTPDEIKIMGEAVEDHRASSDHEPRSIYGKIVAEGDRNIEIRETIKRMLQYGLSHYPELSKEEQIQRATEYLKGKYGEGGYLKLWFPESPNVERLKILRETLKDKTKLRKIFDETWDQITL